MQYVKDTQNRKYYYSINTFRFFFILGIVLFHVHGFFNDPGNAIIKFVYRNGGSMGNIFFFVSSGYLINANHPFTVDIEKRISFISFFGKRLAAIYPLYFASNMIQIAFNCISKGFDSIDLSNAFLSLFFVTEGWIGTTEPYNFPTWFVCVLMVCYLVYYAIYHFSKSKEMFFMLVVAAIIWGYYCRGHQLDYPFCYSVTGSALFNFSIGCLLAVVITSSFNIKRFIYILLYVMFALTTALAIRYGLSNVASDSGAMITLVIMPCLIILCHESNLLNDICKRIVLKHIGDISMHVFFWHIPVFTVYKWLLCRIHMMSDASNGGLLLILYIVLLLIFAELSKAVMENLKRAEIGRRKGLLYNEK